MTAHGAWPVLPTRYQIKRQIGQGGMARVFLAHDAATHSDVAIKVLFEHLQRQPAIVERFKREITITRRITHPHLVQIHELIETDDVLALVMEFVPGVDAKTHLMRHGPMPVEQVTTLLGQALSALGAAHDAHILHRDIKPHNLLLQEYDKGQYILKIADFGLARVDDLISLSTHTQALGTIEYMAPEQLDSSLIDARADLYALGVTAYELLTGMLPFTAPTPMLIAQAHQCEVRPLASDVRSDVPAFLDEWLVRAMAIHPHERFVDAHAMWTALDTKRVRQARPKTLCCQSCEAELIRGLGVCVVCDFPLARAVQYPGQGHLTLLAQGRTARKNVFTQKEQDAILSRLQADVSCQGAIHVDWNLGQLPVILARRLTPEDGARLARLLTTPHTQDIDFVLHNEQHMGTSVRLAAKHIPSFNHSLGLILLSCLVLSSFLGALYLISFLEKFGWDEGIGWVFVSSGIVSLAMLSFMTLFGMGAWRARYKVLDFVGAKEKSELPEWEGHNVLGLERHDLPELASQWLMELQTPHTQALYRELLSTLLEFGQRHQHDQQVRRALGQILEQSTLVAGELVSTEREIKALTSAQRKALDVLAASQDAQEREHAHEVLRRMDAEQARMTSLTGELLALHANLDELHPDLLEHRTSSDDMGEMLEEIALQFEAVTEAQMLCAVPQELES